MPVIALLINHVLTEDVRTMTNFLKHLFSNSKRSILFNPKIHITIVAFLAITIMMSKLDRYGLANYDDAFYAQKAKEVLATGDWMTMHYNHLPAFENPPLFIWLVALSFKVFGVSEYAARFPSALAGVCSVILLYIMTRWLTRDSIAALFSAIVLSTTIIFTRYASRAMMDVTLTFFVTFALFFLLYALKSDRRYFLLWGLSIGICVLIKSVLGFFPLVISVLFLLCTRRWKILFSGWFLLGAIVAVLLGSLWYIHQYASYGSGFLRVHFDWLILQRGLAFNGQAWYEHLSYAKDLLSCYWPWLPVFLLGLWLTLKSAWQKEETAIFLLVWIGTIFITMSYMQTRVLWYVMPVFPACAMVCGRYLGGWISGKKRQKAVIAIIGLALILAVAINSTTLKLSTDRERDVRVLAPYVKYFGNLKCSILAFREDYYGLNNALLFYSDYAAAPSLKTYDELDSIFRRSDTVLVYIDNKELDSLKNHIATLSVVRKSPGKALIANTPLDISSVPVW